MVVGVADPGCQIPLELLGLLYVVDLLHFELPDGLRVECVFDHEEAPDWERRQDGSPEEPFQCLIWSPGFDECVNSEKGAHGDSPLDGGQSEGEPEYELGLEIAESLFGIFLCH